VEKKVFEVPGFVKNESNEAFFKLQRSLPPGGKIKFSDAFLTVGSKSGLEEKNSSSGCGKMYFPELGGVSILPMMFRSFLRPARRIKMLLRPPRPYLWRRETEQVKWLVGLVPKGKQKG